MSVEKSIGWCDMTCNPILGLCQGNCRLPDGRAYCYYSGQRGIAHRFNQDPKLRLDLSVFDKLPKAPKKVFLVSTNDYWGRWILEEWREAIREKTQEYPQHTFQVLTKQYQNLHKDSPYPENWAVGGTATNPEQYRQARYNLRGVEAKIKFISFEPLLEHIGVSSMGLTVGHPLDWVIVGRLTGYGHKYDPKVNWIYEIIEACKRAGIPYFLKDNLRPLLGNNLTQDIPKGVDVGY